MKIHEILRQERRLLNITQRSLADKVGISYVNLSNFESGKANISYNSLLAICDALDFNIILTKKEKQNENNHD